MCSKSIKTKIVFTKLEMNNEWNIHFLPNSSPIPVSFIGSSTYETFLLHSTFNKFPDFLYRHLKLS